MSEQTPTGRDPTLCRCENAMRRGIPMMCLRCTGPVGEQPSATPTPTPDAEPIPDDSLKALIGGLGDEIHNLGCENQNNEDLSDCLARLTLRAWYLAKRASPAPDAVAEADVERLAGIYYRAECGLPLPKEGEQGRTIRTIVMRGIRAVLAALPASQPVADVSGGINIETAAWAWLEKRFGTPSDDPVDRAYDASEMVDAFHGGVGFRAAQVATLTARVETLDGALRLAAPIVEADLCTAEGMGDADWEGLSRTAMDAITAALSPDPAVKPSAEGGAA